RRHTRYWRDWSSDVCSSDLSGIIIERKLYRDGTQTNFIRLRSLDLNVFFQQIRSEDIALQKEHMVVLQRLERFGQRTRNGADLAQFFRRHAVKIFVNRAIAIIAGIDLAADTIQTGHQQRREEQVRVGCGIRWAEFDALRLWIVG